MTQLYIILRSIHSFRPKKPVDKKKHKRPILGPIESNAHSCIYRLGTRKQNNGLGHAVSTIVVFLNILCRPTPTHSGPPMPVKKKKKKILEKAQRYHRDIHSKKLSAEFESFIVSRLREKCARRLQYTVYSMYSMTYSISVLVILVCTSCTRYGIYRY